MAFEISSSRLSFRVSSEAALAAASAGASTKAFELSCSRLNFRVSSEAALAVVSGSAGGAPASPGGPCPISLATLKRMRGCFPSGALAFASVSLDSAAPPPTLAANCTVAGTVVRLAAQPRDSAGSVVGVARLVGVGCVAAAPALTACASGATGGVVTHRLAGLLTCASACTGAPWQETKPITMDTAAAADAATGASELRRLVHCSSDMNVGRLRA
mmetsp:Transcript_33645/g.93146  ORF Transcript_33645/g.93146 Transcript_33645/m.93146 type:complete len:216 (-) Transcript_33645:247-894(-)